MKAKEDEYAYAYGVVSGMTSKLIDWKTMDELTRFRSVEEVVAFLEGTDYEPDIKKAIGKTIKIEEMEKGLKNHFIRIYREIISSLPEEDQKAFDRVIADKIFTENLKIIMRSLHSRMEPERILELLNLIWDKDLLTDLANSKDMEEFISKLEKTRYHKTLQDNLGKYRELGNLLPLENALDKKVIEDWREIALPDIQNFASLKTDVANIRTILRCAYTDLPAAEYVIRGGLYLKEKLEDMVKKDAKEVIEMLDKTPYGKAVKEAVNEYEKTKSLVAFDTKLESEVSRILKELAILRPLSLNSIILFIDSKMKEVKNLNTIITCKGYEIPPEEIREILVGEYGA